MVVFACVLSGVFQVGRDGFFCNPGNGVPFRASYFFPDIPGVFLNCVRPQCWFFGLALWESAELELLHRAVEKHVSFIIIHG